ncbi:MAG: hypothetical protein WCP04_04645 [Pseudomonadota bacterium]
MDRAVRLPRRWGLRIAAALLPLLLLRALVPMGFMASVADGAVRYTFCDGAAHTLPHTSAAGDHACPFAQSAGAAPLSALVVMAAHAPSHTDAAPTFNSPFPGLAGPARQHRARAPPLLSLV